MKILICLLLVSSTVWAKALVSPESITLAKKATTVHRLSNGAQVVYRRLPGSQLFNLGLLIDKGQADLPPSDPIDSLIALTMTKATKTQSKERLSSTIEKLALQLHCGAANDYFYCDVGAIKADWQAGVNTLSSVVKEPLFQEEELKISIDRLQASLKSVMSDPESLVTEAANQLFFPPSHPYRISYKEMMAKLPSIDKKALHSRHESFLNARLMTLVVAADLPERELLKVLNAQFGDIGSGELSNKKLGTPSFDFERRYTQITKPNPTAYIEIIFNAPHPTSPEATAFAFLMKLLSDQLFDDVRSKKSLTYAIQASYSRQDVPQAKISTSSSKPNEILPAIAAVIQDLKNKERSRIDIDERKTIYTTHFYSTQESNRSFVSSLASTTFWQKSPLYFYEFPTRLDKIGPKDVRDLARKWLRDFRVAIVFDEKKVDQSIFEKFIEDSLGKATKKSLKSNRNRLSP